MFIDGLYFQTDQSILVKDYSDIKEKVLSLVDSPSTIGFVISTEVISDGNRWTREAMRPVSTLLFYCRIARNR